MAVTSAEMTAATQVAFAPTIWAKDTRDAITYEEVLAKLVNTQYEDEMRIGRTLTVPTRSNLNTQDHTEGISNTINFQAFTDVTQTVTIDTQEYAARLLNEVVKAQSKYDERQRIAKDLGYALMRGVEVALAALFQSFSQIVGTLGADPDDAVLRRAWQYLRDAAVRSDANWIFGPAAVAALFGNDKFTSKDFVSAKSVIETATLPSLYGYPAYISNLLRNPATGQTECGLLHREAIILVRQVRPTVKEQYQITNLADGIVAFDLYNCAEATWIAEAPGGDSPGTAGDYGAVLIRSA